MTGLTSFANSTARTRGRSGASTPPAHATAAKTKAARSGRAHRNRLFKVQAFYQPLPQVLAERADLCCREACSAHGTATRPSSPERSCARTARSRGGRGDHVRARGARHCFPLHVQRYPRAPDESRPSAVQSRRAPLAWLRQGLLSNRGRPRLVTMAVRPPRGGGSAGPREPGSGALARLEAREPVLDRKCEPDPVPAHRRG